MAVAATEGLSSQMWSFFSFFSSDISFSSFSFSFPSVADVSDAGTLVESPLLTDTNTTTECSYSTMNKVVAVDKISF